MDLVVSGYYGILCLLSKSGSGSGSRYTIYMGFDCMFYSLFFSLLSLFLLLFGWFTVCLMYYFRGLACHVEIYISPINWKFSFS